MRDDNQTSDTATPTIRQVVENSEHDSKLLQAIIDALGSSIVLLDEDRTIVFANRSWRQFAARSGSLGREHGVGKKYPDVFSGPASASNENASAIRAGLIRIIANEEIDFQLKYRCTALTEPVWLKLHAASFLYPAGDGQRLLLVSHDDVSKEQFEADDANGNDERLHRLLKTSNILPWESSADKSRYTYVGEQAADLLGYTVDEWQEEGFWVRRLHPADRDRVVAEYARLSRSTEHFKSEYRMIANDGQIVWVQDMVRVVRDWARASTMHGFMTDITDRKQTESALADLSGRFITAQEEERKRIARELHDDLNQRIALISIELEQVAQKSAAGTTGIGSRLGQIQRKVAEISTAIHRMSYQLHPSKLDHLGLGPALNSFCDELGRGRGIRIDFYRESVPAVLPRDITLCVFRVAQEALQNAAKYSGAAEVNVNLTGSAESLELTVSDKGEGFVLSPQRMTRGLGFTSMRERVRIVGGEFTVHSAPSQGTVVRITVPIPTAPPLDPGNTNFSSTFEKTITKTETKGAPNETYKNYFGRRSYAAG